MIRLGWTEKWTLRFAVVGLLCMAVSGFEGLLMRIELYDSTLLRPMEDVLNNIRPLSQAPTQAEVFYSMLSAHPIVGIYGFAYMLVMGAFYFLVPFLLNKEIRHKRLVPVNFWLQIIGVGLCWCSGFFLMFNALYTLYWPLPVAYDRVPVHHRRGHHHDQYPPVLVQHLRHGAQQERQWALQHHGLRALRLRHPSPPEPVRTH